MPNVIQSLINLKLFYSNHFRLFSWNLYLLLRYEYFRKALSLKLQKPNLWKLLLPYPHRVLRAAPEGHPFTQTLSYQSQLLHSYQYNLVQIDFRSYLW